MKPSDTQQTLPAAAHETHTAILPDRYQDLGRIGQGGMGEVRQVRDLHLNRRLVMKILRWSLFEDQAARARFLDEAQMGARLAHPGIVPVHEQGMLEDGRPWFTMRQIEGRTLRTVAAEVHRASVPQEWRSGPNGWTLRRLVAALETVCRVVAYVHAEGVIHCDLKPDNIMIGPFSEILLVDWGIARVVSNKQPVQILGTPRYMSPEQRRGEVSPAADVFALGAVLHTLLRGVPPGEDLGQYPPSPPDLLRLVVAATTPDATARPTASKLADQIRLWLEGARRRERAGAELAAARKLAAEPQRLRNEAETVRCQAAALLKNIPVSAPAAQKRTAWELEEIAEGLDTDADRAEVAYTGRLRAALEHDSSLSEAHERLADHYRAALEQAEAAMDGRAAVYAQAMLKAHDRGVHATWLKGLGALTLRTDPPARATLFRFTQRHRRLVPERVRDLGITPLIQTPLLPGSYVIRLESRGYPTVDYPVHIGRCEHWNGVPPGGQNAAVIRLPTFLEEGECWVPAGWFISGGDTEALDGLPLRRLWLDGFIAHRNPVTHGEYLTFLNAIGDNAEAWVPAELEPSSAKRLLYRRDTAGRFQLGATHDGVPLHPRDPVIYVDRDCASAYAAWLADTTGHDWRLPHEQEWEKAARGVDGRPYPWGNGFDPSFCCMANSHAGVPCWAPVDASPLDCSVYGVRGLAGNVRDWCANAYTRESGSDRSAVLLTTAIEGDLGLIRGGSWTSVSSMCRAAGRFAGAVNRLKSLGFRLVRSV